MRIPPTGSVLSRVRAFRRLTRIGLAIALPLTLLGIAGGTASATRSYSATVQTSIAVSAVSSAPNTLTLSATVATVSGYAAPTGTVSFEELAPGSSLVALSGATSIALTNGEASVTLSNAAAGSYTIYASYSGDSTYQSIGFESTDAPPAQVTISSTSIDNTQTTLSVSPSVIPPGGTGRVTATVIDQNGNPVVGATVTFWLNSAGTGQLTPSEPETDQNGIASTTFTAASSGNFTIVATFRGPSSTTSVDYGTIPSASASFTVGGAPTITSGDQTTFRVDAPASFSVTTSAVPVASLAESGALPNGLSFVDNGNGTATLSGTPAAGTSGLYHLTITATNGVSPDASQSFSLYVDAPPVITSAANLTLDVGGSSVVNITTSGYPLPTITESGSLPSGMSFVDNGDGTATISGTPAPGSNGTYAISLTAANGVSPNATEQLVLTVQGVAAPPIVCLPSGDDVLGALSERQRGCERLLSDQSRSGLSEGTPQQLRILYRDDAAIATGANAPVAVLYTSQGAPRAVLPVSVVPAGQRWRDRGGHFVDELVVFVPANLAKSLDKVVVTVHDTTGDEDQASWTLAHWSQGSNVDGFTRLGGGAQGRSFTGEREGH